MTTAATVDAIRLAFPALRRTHRGIPVAYFDGPGGTQVPSAVVEAMSDYLLHHNANTHWVYPTSEETDALLLDARRAYASFFNGTPEEVVFGNNMTTITFHVARALGRGWKEGDEVIVTELDHHANVAPWQAVARERGVVLRWLPFDVESGRLDLGQLEGLITPRTRLLAIGAASNALGTINDVVQATTIARAAGVLTWVDGVHYSPHVLPDVAALGADFFVCSSYKFYGPHAGILWGRRELLERVDAPKLEPAPDTAPERLETGTQNHEGIVGAAAALRWIASLSGRDATLRDQLASAYAMLHEREARLFERLWDGLGDIAGLTRHGPPPGTPRTATIAFAVSGVSSERIARGLADRACFVSNGDFYATTVVRRLRLDADGLVRVGAACYTTADEIDRVISGVQAIAAP